MDPEVSVVVASQARETRLRTLLDALAEQTLRAERREVVVAHTYDAAAAGRLFAERDVREVRVDPARARPSVQREAGWRAARGELVAFTDDDCRPRPDWLEQLVAVARRRPGDIVQGATHPDPRDVHHFQHAHFSALAVEPPADTMQTCNILYPRALLERVGGFDERAVTGEDIDLGWRARATGAALAPAPDAVVYHAIEPLSAIGKVRSQLKWRHLAYVVRKHPHLREGCEWGVWWKPEHPRATLALLALAGARRHPLLLAGAIPYVRLERWRHGPSRRQQARSLMELPTHLAVELAEVATFAAGSVRYRSLLL